MIHLPLLCLRYRLQYLVEQTCIKNLLHLVKSPLSYGFFDELKCFSNDSSSIVCLRVQETPVQRFVIADQLEALVKALHHQLLCPEKEEILRRKSLLTLDI